MSRNSPKNKPFEVGLTGGIGAGKSVVAQVWEVLGIPVFYADAAGRRVLDDPKVASQVAEILGNEVYRDGKADRAKIASRVFGQPQKLESLNAIVHPAVGERYREWMSAHGGAPYVLKEAAILIEIGHAAAYESIVLVTAPESLRLERIMERSGYTREEGKSRIEAQWPDERKTPHADYIIKNDGEAALIPQVLRIHEALLKKAAQPAV